MSDSRSASESKPSGQLVLLLALLSLAILGLTSPGAPLVVRCVPVALAGGVCILSAQRTGFHLVFASLVLAVTVLVAAGVLWQVSLALSLGVAFLVRRYINQSSESVVQRGRVPVGFTLFAALVTPGALVGWVYLLKPDISDLTGMIPDVPTWLLVLSGVVFALANATLEELVWRGHIQTSLREEFSLPWAVMLQALSFGIAHAHGFPRGAVGVALAGSWAVILGVLRHVSGGLLAPVLAHIVADATIASIVIWLAPVG